MQKNSQLIEITINGTGTPDYYDIIYLLNISLDVPLQELQFLRSEGIYFVMVSRCRGVALSWCRVVVVSCCRGDAVSWCVMVCFSLREDRPSQDPQGDLGG